MLQVLFIAVAIISSESSVATPIQERADWNLSAEPVLEIDGAWGSIAGVRRLPSGRFFVSDQMSREVTVHDAAGAHIATAGGSGSGPGEFRTLNKPLVCGRDSVYFWDSGLGRISVFDADGSYQRSFSDLEVRPAGPGFQGVTEVDCTRQGVFVTTSWSMTQPPREEGVTRLEIAMHVAEEGGDPITLGPFPGDEMYWAESQLSRQPFGTRTVFAVTDDRLYAGVTDQFAVDVFSLSGERSGSISDDMVRKPLSRSILEAFLATRPDQHRAAWAAREYPEHLPAFSMLLADSEGNLWVQEYPVPGESESTWRVYSPAGHRLATLNMPSGFAATQVGADFVLGVSRDALGVESVRMYRLVKG